MKTDQTVTEFDSEEKTVPVTIDAAVRQRLRDGGDGVPEAVEDEVTQPIRFGSDLGQPPELPAALTIVTDQDDLMTVTDVDGLDLSDFEDEETTRVPTGD